MRQEILRMERVTCEEHDVTQLEEFNLQIYRGEIMGLLPINAHGLSAFLSLLQTNLPIRDGYIYYCEERVNSWRGARKTPNRIAVISERSCLVEGLTVADNVFVIRQGFRQRLIHTRFLRRQLEPFLKNIGMDISADSYVERLTTFERVVVEILKAVIMEHRLIVLNEIGTLISDTELQKLHGIVRYYSGKGFSFLYIGPHFEEMSQVCDRVALLSHGRIQKILKGAELVKEDLREYTQEYDRMVRTHLESCSLKSRKGELLLRIDDITSGPVRHMSLDIYAGECVTLQHLDNEVYQEVLRLLGGETCQEEGSFWLNGQRTDLFGNRDIAVIQELPTRSMLFGSMSYLDNLCMGLAQRIPNIWSDHHIRDSIRKEYGPILGEDVFYTSVEKLSERQKYQLVYIRILLQRPKIVFCIQPFKGADLPHRMRIWKLLEMLLDKGIAVAILTLNLADSISLAERLLRIGNGGAVEEITRDNFGSLSSTVPWRYLYREEN
ncbi:MAG: sugar ABC transporter ATP-binding protein [Clostridiales bacterium]|nr:sugar ABC transporter ATP-binding protein [Clostridiales bacterium]